MLTEASWTVPSSVPEARSVYTAFNSVILGPSPALMIDRRVAFSTHALVHQKTQTLHHENQPSYSEFLFKPSLNKGVIILLEAPV